MQGPWLPFQPRGQNPVELWRHAPKRARRIQHPQKELRQTQVVKTQQIVRDAKTYDLYTFPVYKRYQLVYDKRVIDPSTFQTYPYGYQARCQDTP